VPSSAAQLTEAQREHAKAIGVSEQEYASKVLGAKDGD